MRALAPPGTELGTVSLKSLRPITQRLTCSVRRVEPLTVIFTVTFVSRLFGVQLVSTKIRCELPIQSARTFVTVSGVAAAAGSATSAHVAVRQAIDVRSKRRICSQPTLEARRRPHQN